jgi:hypothetical protein
MDGSFGGTGLAAVVDRQALHELWLDVGAAVHASAQLMAARASGVSAEDITVAAFVAFARGEGGAEGPPLARLLRLAGRAARGSHPVLV